MDRFSLFVKLKIQEAEITQTCPACGGGDLVAKSYLTLCNHMACSRHVPLSMGFSRQEY